MTPKDSSPSRGPLLLDRLAEEFLDHDCEIEKSARDIIGADFEFIAKAYGFDVDNEELIAPRDW